MNGIFEYASVFTRSKSILSCLCSLSTSIHWDFHPFVKAKPLHFLEVTLVALAYRSLRHATD